MSQLSLDKLRLKVEDWRVSQHFKRIEAILRHKDVNHLPPDLQKAREQHLNQLHTYATRGIFPRNHEQPNYSPCFIDRDGRECAVAHLVMTSGHPDLAHKIAVAANYAYVPQMTFPELDSWAAQTGLSKKELALIQPGYYIPHLYTDSVQLILITAWAAGFGSVLINAIHIARRRNGMIVPLLSSVLAIILCIIGIFCLNSATIVYETAFVIDTPLPEIGYFNASALMSFALALLTGGLSLYRLWNFRRFKAQTPL